MKHSLPLLILSFLFLCAAKDDYKAEFFKRYSMEAKFGAVIVFNGEKHSLVLDVAADSVSPTEDGENLYVNDMFLQYVVFPFTEKLDFGSLGEDMQKKLLLDHRKYYLEYLNEKFKASPNEDYEFTKLNGKLFLLWRYSMPDTFKLNRQYYLTTICFDQILLLNTPVEKGKDTLKGRDLLLNIGKTLKMNDDTLNLDKYYDEIMK